MILILYKEHRVASFAIHVRVIVSLIFTRPRLCSTRATFISPTQCVILYANRLRRRSLTRNYSLLSVQSASAKLYLKLAVFGLLSARCIVARRVACCRVTFFIYIYIQLYSPTAQVVKNNNNTGRSPVRAEGQAGCGHSKIARVCVLNWPLPLLISV